MAKTALKITAQNAVIRCTGAATHTITMASIVSPRQTAVVAPTATIKGIKWTVPVGATASITRNAVLLYDFPAGSWGCFDFTNYTDNEGKGSSIVITITGNAAVIVELSKDSGWGDEAHMNQSELG
jgi:hypothetical protein